jgi:catechol 2,3-dioxygenase-like lactoylglutathione lyase family enzyme
MNTIKRLVPDIKSTRRDESRAFYVDFLGLKLGMDLGFVMTFISPSNPTAQISVVRDEVASRLQPNMSVEVADVDEVHAQAIRHSLEIGYPLTDEPWGVRLFFVVDPNGTVLNILSHIPSSGALRRFQRSPLPCGTKGAPRVRDFKVMQGPGATPNSPRICHSAGSTGGR